MDAGYTVYSGIKGGVWSSRRVGPPLLRSPPPGPSPTRFYSGSPPSRSKEFPSRPSAEQQAADFSSVDVEDCYVRTCCIRRHNSVLATRSSYDLTARYIGRKSAARTGERETAQKEKEKEKEGGRCTPQSPRCCTILRQAAFLGVILGSTEEITGFTVSVVALTRSEELVCTTVQRRVVPCAIKEYRRKRTRVSVACSPVHLSQGTAKRSRGEKDPRKSSVVTRRIRAVILNVFAAAFEFERSIDGRFRQGTCVLQARPTVEFLSEDQIVCCVIRRPTINDLVQRGSVTDRVCASALSL